MVPEEVVKDCYKYSVGILVWNKDHTKILTVSNRTWGGFSAPGGKVEHGETTQEAAYRELLEETGLHAHSLIRLAGFPHEPRGNDPREWYCTYYKAEVGDQEPRQIEEGTVPEWRYPWQLLEQGMYPDFYEKLFSHVEELRESLCEKRKITGDT